MYEVVDTGFKEYEFDEEEGWYRYAHSGGWTKCVYCDTEIYPDEFVDGIEEYLASEWVEPPKMRQADTSNQEPPDWVVERNWR